MSAATHPAAPAAAPAVTTDRLVVLIPAYEPDARLVALIRSLRLASRPIEVVVVDDGSGPGFRSVFRDAAALGAEVIGHPDNRGKGAALRAGFAHVAIHHPGLAVVCADCDGQHTVADILAVADEIGRHDRAMVLGARRFVGDVPAKSRMGNDVTRAVFHAVTGLRLQDTQTGLRAYPPGLLQWLGTIGGDRFEYELDMLLAARRSGIPMVEVGIETIYLDGNESSHFRPIRDSVRVYLPFLRFSASSSSRSPWTPASSSGWWPSPTASPPRR